MSRFVISSVERVMDMLKTYPKVANIPAFQGLRDLAQVDPNACCGSKVDLAKYQPQFLRAMTSLTQGQKQQLKSILGVDEICYFGRAADGSLQLNCS